MATSPVDFGSKKTSQSKLSKTADEFDTQLGSNNWVIAPSRTTTGRPRRIGWLDMVALNFASKINGFTHLNITKLDCLSELDEIKILSLIHI